MTWMLTASGANVDLRFIAQGTIDILDIAHHLAQINRFTGACSRPYSVAEHSLLVCELVERAIGILPADPSVLLAALMHDAHEAYTTDLSSPMKQIVGAAWSMEEQRIQHAVLKRFELLTASTSARTLIHWADLTALSTERAQLLPPGGIDWPVSRTHPPCDWWRFDERAEFTWLDWRQAFLDRFSELQFARRDRLERLKDLITPNPERLP